MSSCGEGSSDKASGASGGRFEEQGTWIPLGFISVAFSRGNEIVDSLWFTWQLLFGTLKKSKPASRSDRLHLKLSGSCVTQLPRNERPTWRTVDPLSQKVGLRPVSSLLKS